MDSWIESAEASYGFKYSAEFMSVYDPGVDWFSVKSGFLTRKDGKTTGWFMRKLPEEKDIDPERFDADTYSGKLEPLLISSHFIKYHGMEVADTWSSIRKYVFTLLRDAPGREMTIVGLMDKLNSYGPRRPPDTEKTLKMMLAYGDVEALKKASGVSIKLSASNIELYDRRDYLVTFSDELLIKSRRIDSLIAHTGTVGSYREGLLKNLLVQLLPKRYEASTGFVEGCARQIDIIIWDSFSYIPSFRDSDIVVVPREAVRAAIEVKTELNTNSLDESMHILWDAFGTEQTIIPIFKGIFAYSARYVNEIAVAKRMKKFYHSSEPDGIVDHMHRHLYAGVSCVCVPQRFILWEKYARSDDPDKFAQPTLSTIDSDWTGDIRLPVFLNLLLAHLDLPAASKKLAAGLISPMHGEVELRKVAEIYEGDWRPWSALSTIAKTLNVDGCSDYLKQITEFFEGDRPADQVGAGLGNAEPPPLSSEDPENTTVSG